MFDTAQMEGFGKKPFGEINTGMHLANEGLQRSISPSVQHNEKSSYQSQFQLVCLRTIENHWEPLRTIENHGLNWSPMNNLLLGKTQRNYWDPPGWGLVKHGANFQLTKMMGWSNHVKPSIFLSISWVKFDPYIPYLGMDITSLPSGPKKRREALSTAKPKTPEPGCQAARLSRIKGDPWWPGGIGNMSNNVSCHLRIACISCITSQDRSGFSNRWLRFCHDSSPVFGGSPLAGLPTIVATCPECIKHI